MTYNPRAIATSKIKAPSAGLGAVEVAADDSDGPKL